MTIVAQSPLRRSEIAELFLRDAATLLLRSVRYCKTPIPLDGDSATIRNFCQNDTNRSRNGKSAVEAQ